MAKQNRMYRSNAPAAGATISTQPAPSGAPANVAVQPATLLGQALAALASQPMVPPGAVATDQTAIAPQAAPVVAPAAPSTPVHPSQVVVTLGKPYNVRAGTQNNNVRSWQAICAFLASKGGQATVAEIANHLQGLYNHANMAGYCVRRGYLVPVSSLPAPVPQATAACLGL